MAVWNKTSQDSAARSNAQDTTASRTADDNWARLEGRPRRGVLTGALALSAMAALHVGLASALSSLLLMVG